jgi:glucans biosynthesis protein C
VLLLVSAHVIGLSAASGMRVAESSPFRHFTETFEYVRMPLFTVISGFVYDMRPAIAGKLFTFLRGKARRLLLPMITVSTLQFLVKSSVPAVHDDERLAGIARIYFYPFDHLWFLQSLSIVFVVVALLEGYNLLRPLSGWLGFWVAAAVTYFFAPRLTTFFSFPLALFLMPFFMLGMGLRRYATELKHPKLVALMAITFLTVCVVKQLELFGLWNVELATMWFGFIGSVSGCSLLVWYRQPLPWLAWIGSYAYTIYLLHVFGAAGSRILLQKIGLEQRPIVFVVGIVCGIAFPIVADRVLRMNRVSRLMVLGLSAKKQAKKPAPLATAPALASEPRTSITP